MFIEIEDIKKSYGNGENEFQVLKGISFSANKGEMVVLLGPSGSGKSTLLNIIGGIDTLDTGKVGIDGEYIENMSEKGRIAYRRKNLGYVFQSYNLIPIGLARGFLSGAKLILLDEVTSNVDAINEGIILKSIKNIKDKAFVIVSHRESTVSIANRIYHIQGGKI